MAALYTTDADYVSSTGLTAKGRAEIEKAYVNQFSGVYKKGKRSTPWRYSTSG